MMRNVRYFSQMLWMSFAQCSDWFSHVYDLCLSSYPEVCVLSQCVMFNVLFSIFVCQTQKLYMTVNSAA